MMEYHKTKDILHIMQVLGHKNINNILIYAHLIDAGDLREKTMISLLALGGFRVGTLCRLEYRHVRRNVEAGVVPVQLHVEAEITNGKYTDYDTFISQEAVDYLRGIYASAGLSIKPKSQMNKLKMLKTIIRAYGLDPDKVLVKEALTEPPRFVHPDDYERQIQTLNQRLREIVTREPVAIQTLPKTV